MQLHPSLRLPTAQPQPLHILTPKSVRIKQIKVGYFSYFDITSTSSKKFIKLNWVNMIIQAPSALGHTVVGSGKDPKKNSLNLKAPRRKDQSWPSLGINLKFEKIVVFLTDLLNLSYIGGGGFMCPPPFCFYFFIKNLSPRPNP